MKELKMLEILKSKANKVMKKNENRKIQKNLDAMALRIEEEESNYRGSVAPSAS